MQFFLRLLLSYWNWRKQIQYGRQAISLSVEQRTLIEPDPAIPPSFIEQLKFAVRTGYRAAYRSRYAGLALWCFGCFIIFSYYLSPAVKEWLDQVGAYKERNGFAFSAISTAIFGGTIPSLLHWATQRQYASKQHSQSTKTEPTYLLSNTLFWAAKGIEVDALYRFQSLVFGDQLDFTTILYKTLFDQIVYAPAIGLTGVILFYLLRDCNYDFSKFRLRLNRSWFQTKLLPAMVSNWLIWIPAVILIYNMPSALQLPVQNLILCFWVLMLTILATSSGSDDECGTTTESSENEI